MKWLAVVTHGAGVIVSTLGHLASALTAAGTGILPPTAGRDPEFHKHDDYRP
jgi:hypothetical protein